MSKVDDVFGPIPGPLIQEWGQDAVFIQAGAPAYDGATGTVTKAETRTSVKIVVAQLDIKESGGLYQGDEVKILLDPGQISDHYISTADYFEGPKAGGTEIMKVVEPRTYRGDNPVFFVIIARPQ